MFTQITQAVTTALYDAFTKNRPQSVSPCRRKRRMVGSATSEAPDASVKSEVSEKTISITYNVPGRILFFLLLFLPFLPVCAQQMTGKDTCYVFRFKPGNDTFYVPYKENENELERLSAMLKEYALPLQSGKLYIGVSSYAASAPSSTSSSRKLSARRIAYLRCSRVKSELIVRHGITEQMFVTDRLLPHPYRDSLRNVVVVTFPAGIAKVKELAGEAAARRVSAYIKETTAEPAPVASTVHRRIGFAIRCSRVSGFSIRLLPPPQPPPLGHPHPRPRRRMAHQPPHRHPCRRFVDFVEPGQQEPPLRPLESVAGTALLYR